MREMKDSGIEWIGEIPVDWEVSRIKQLFSEVNDRCENSENYTLLSVSEYYGVAPKSERISDDDMLTHAETLDGYKICKENDLVMNIMLAWKRAMGVSEYTGIVSPAYCIYRGKQNMCAKYFHYLFRTDMYANLFKQYSTGIIDSRLRLYPDKFFALKCQVPPVDTQHRIADYLGSKCSQIDTIIARQKEVIEKLKAYKLSVITEAVTSTDSQMCRFRNCITTIEQGWSPAPAEIVGEDGWFVLSLSAVKNGKFIKLSKKPIDANENIPTKLSIKVGDLLMTRSNTRELVGDVCLVDSDCPKTIFSDLIYRISLNDTLLPCYAIFLLQSAFIRQQIQESARGSSGTMPKISHKSIKNLNIYLPSIPEQREISGFLRNKCNCIDTCIQEKERLIKKLTAYKKSLIYEVVTGKKEV